MIKIDGSYGEGGGQILRTSLSLSCLTSLPIEIFNIRAKRKKPGLQAQHLTVVQSLKKISQAQVKGDFLNSTWLKFIPQKIKGGKYKFDIGTAGSTSLVAQSLLLPLSFASQRSEIFIKGGTHNPLSPSYHYLKEIFRPMVLKLGLNFNLELLRYGFYPKGGGVIKLKIQPIKKIKGMNFLQRGELEKIDVFSCVANLPLSIAIRQIKGLKGKIDYLFKNINFRKEQVKAFSPGSFIFLKAKFKNTIAGFDLLGEKGKPAEKVGEEVGEKFLNYFKTQKALDPYLADQIILYLALAKESSFFTTSEISSHLETHAHLLNQFLNVKIEINKEKKEVRIKKN